MRFRRRHAATIGIVLGVLVPLATALAITLYPSAPANASKQKGYNGEGTVAVNPADPSKVFASFNNHSDVSQWRRSTDGGRTWIVAGKGIEPSCCDNVAEWDGFGNLYLTNLNAQINEIPLYISTDNGANFTKRSIDIGGLDQPAVKAGPNSVWLTWNDNGTIKARGAAVTGLGSVGTFSAEQSAPASDECQFGDIAVGPDGKVVAVCQTDTEVDAYTDADGLGAGGFGAPVAVTDVNVNKFDPIAPQQGRTIDAEANLAYDLSGGAHDGRLYMVYTDAPIPVDQPPDFTSAHNNTDIYVRYSDDDGATWSTRVKVNDDATTTAQFFPVVTVDPTTGNVFVSFLDCRDDPVDNTHTEYWGAVSTDGGATWSANAQLSAGQSSSAEQSDFLNEYGDYSGNDFYGGYGYAIWPDSSNSTGDNPDGAHQEFDMYVGTLDTQASCFGLHATVVGTTGTTGDDVIIGTSGNDAIDGMDGNDTICALGGDDDITDGPGKDRIDGGPGDDTLHQGTATNGADRFLGGDGVDTVDYAGRTIKVTVRLDGKQKGGQSGEGDVVGADVENAVGGAGGDKLTGNDSVNTLTGGAGKDTLVGRGAADTLEGMDGVGGNDTLDGSKEKPAPLADTCHGDPAPPKADKLKNCS